MATRTVYHCSVLRNSITKVFCKAVLSRTRPKHAH